MVRVDGFDQEAMDQKAVSGLPEPLDASFQSMSAGPHTQDATPNLIPLIFFRPLRLCTSSEQLRNARIVLLRATHLPYVAAIWAYETASRYWSDRRDQWLNRTGAPKRSLLATHISFSHKASKYSAMRNRSEASLMANPPRSAGHTHQAKDLDTMAELRKVLEKLSTQEEMIEKLSRQVETLTTQPTL
ncbi:MAG: hypothetical protein Q9194_002599 [Teloschistes cf. exilis]